MLLITLFLITLPSPLFGHVCSDPPVEIKPRLLFRYTGQPGVDQCFFEHPVRAYYRDQSAGDPPQNCFNKTQGVEDCLGYQSRLLHLTDRDILSFFNQKVVDFLKGNDTRFIDKAFPLGLMAVKADCINSTDDAVLWDNGLHQTIARGNVFGSGIQWTEAGSNCGAPPAGCPLIHTYYTVPIPPVWNTKQRMLHSVAEYVTICHFNSKDPIYASSITSTDQEVPTGDQPSDTTTEVEPDNGSGPMLMIDLRIISAVLVIMSQLQM